MESADRIIGRLEAHHKDLHERLVVIEKKLDFFTWKVAGLATTISIIGALLLK